MSKKLLTKITVDCVMVLMLPLLMAYELVGRKAHEWMGAGIIMF